MTVENYKKKALEIVAKAEKEKRDLSDDEKKSLEEIRKCIDEKRADEDEETPSGNTASGDTEEQNDDKASGDTEDDKDDEEENASGDTSGDTDDKEDEPSGATPSGDTKNEEKNNINIITHKKIMEKRFSLIKAIRNVAEGKEMDSLTKAVSAEGAKEFRNAGLSFGGQIQLPTEKRDIKAVSTEGEDIVATDVFDVLEPLRSKLVLTQAGARVIDNLVGDVKIPSMTAENVFWAGENAEAVDGAGAFTNVKLSPKRLTAYVDISKQFIAQDGVGAENIIREDLVNAIAHKLQATILGAEAGSETQPAGLFNAIAPVKVTDFKSVVDLEAKIEDANVNGSIAYVASNKAKAYFRDLQKGSKNSALLAYANGELDGTPVYSTSDVDGAKYLVGDFSNLYIGQWSGIDLVVDNFTQATKGAVRLVINAYFDAAVVRPGTIVAGDFAAA